MEQAEKQSGIFAGPQPHGEVLKINVKKSNFSENSNRNKKPSNKKCFRCDAGDHFANSCPYRNKSRHLYRQVGHLAKVCKSRGKSVSGRPTSKQGKFHKVHQMVEH